MKLTELALQFKMGAETQGILTIMVLGGDVSNGCTFRTIDLAFADDALENFHD